MSLGSIYIYHICRRIRAITVAMTMMLTCYSGFAQEYCQHWITAPLADSTAQIWYRKQIVPTKKIKKAYVSISTTGYADVYANERNVSKYSLNPYRQKGSKHITSATYNISPYLNSDTLTIGVWYSPLSSASNNKHISAVVYGRYIDDTPFAFVTDNSWLCRPSATKINANNGEDIDGNINQYQWKTHSNYSLALWQMAKETKYKTAEITPSTQGEAYKVNDIINYNYFDANGDTICYDFRNGFYGLLRITFRNAIKGEKIHIGNNTYTCSGELDEQAIIRFMPSYMRKIIIFGDKKFKISHIANIEALNIGTTSTPYW